MGRGMVRGGWVGGFFMFGLGVTFHNWNQALAHPFIDTRKLPYVSGSAAQPQVVNFQFSLSSITSLCPPSCLDLSLSFSPW